MAVKKASLFLLIVLPFLFLADILYGLMEYYRLSLLVTPGVVLRGLLLLLAFVVIILFIKQIEKREIQWIAFLVILSIPGLLIGFMTGSDMPYNISGISKVLYLPVLTVFFVLAFNSLKISSDDVFSYLEFSAYFLGISLLLSQLFGVRNETYGDYAFGSIGVFHAQNDLTLAFGLSLLAASYRLVYVDFSLIRFFLLSASLFACLQIGTNSALAIPVIIACVLTAVYFVGGVSGSLTSYFFKFFILIFALIILLLLFLKVLDLYLSYDYQARKIGAIMQGELSREPLTFAAEKYISSRSYLFDFFGEGFDSFHRGVAYYFSAAIDRRIVESDPYDIFGAHGIFFLIAIYSYLLRYFFMSLKKLISYKNSACYALISSSVFLYIFYSVLVGHALTSPIPSTLLAAYLASFYVARDEAKGGVGVA